MLLWRNGIYESTFWAIVTKLELSFQMINYLSIEATIMVFISGAFPHPLDVGCALAGDLSVSGTFIFGDMTPARAHLLIKQSVCTIQRASRSERSSCILYCSKSK